MHMCSHTAHCQCVSIAVCLVRRRRKRKTPLQHKMYDNYMQVSVHNSVRKSVIVMYGHLLIFLPLGLNCITLSRQLPKYMLNRVLAKCFTGCLMLFVLESIIIAYQTRNITNHPFQWIKMLPMVCIHQHNLLQLHQKPTTMNQPAWTSKLT